MLFDIGWPELLLIGVVALVVIGPKDLPRALRVAGYWVRKARNLSREFQSSVEQMIREAELDEMRKDLQKATEFDIEKEFNKTIDPDGSLAESIRSPDIPDHFDEAPKSVAALPEPELEPELPLPLPDEPRAAEPATAGDAVVTPAVTPSSDTPVAVASAPDPTPAARDPAPSKT
jgi:sec-independent protein translocase protein TatB